jgi:hypothetical protein
MEPAPKFQITNCSSRTKVCPVTKEYNQSHLIAVKRKCNGSRTLGQGLNRVKSNKLAAKVIGRQSRQLAPDGITR